MSPLNDNNKQSAISKYSVNQHLIENILNCVKSGEIAIPEIQHVHWSKDIETAELLKGYLENEMVV